MLKMIFVVFIILFLKEKSLRGNILSSPNETPKALSMLFILIVWHIKGNNFFQYANYFKSWTNYLQNPLDLYF